MIILVVWPDIEFSPSSFIIGAIVMVFLVPLLTYALRILLKHAEDITGFWLEGRLYYFTRRFRQGLAARYSIKLYCRLQLREPNRYLQVPNLDSSLETDDLFVTLALEHQGGDRATYSHNDLVSLGDRIRIVGDPGSGKSSLVKKLLRDRCRAAISQPMSGPLPIVVELKNLVIPPEVLIDHLGEWFLGELRSRVANFASYSMDDVFDIYASASGLLVMLDGLDEVSTTEYPRMSTAINGLSQKLGQTGDRNIIILTRRIQFHQQVRTEYQVEFPNVVSLKPFSPSDIYEFLSRWPFAEERDLKVARIFSTLTDRPTLRDMCTNPLVLAMYVADDLKRQDTLTPETRTEFYEIVTDEPLVNRRSRQTEQSSGRLQTKNEREDILGKLAYEHLLDPGQPANTLSWEEGVRVTADRMKCSMIDAEERFVQIATDTGLISEERPKETFRFIHLTFCEFLAAHKAAKGRENGWDDLIGRHRKWRDLASDHLNSRLIEVIPFTAGIISKVRHTRRLSLINDVASLNDGSLLAPTFLETKLYDHPAWPSFVTSQHDLLVAEPEENWDDQWLRRLHLFNVVVTDSQISNSNGSAQIVDMDAMFRTLTGQQQESLSKLLTAYAIQDAAAAFRLAEVLNLDIARDFPELVVEHCDQKPFFGLIVAKAREDQNMAHLWAALLAEAALRSGIVAQMCSEIDPLPEWAQHMRGLSRKQRWDATWLGAQSLLTDCIFLAT